VIEVIKPVEESKPVEDNKPADVTEPVTEKTKVVADDDEVM